MSYVVNLCLDYGMQHRKSYEHLPAFGSTLFHMTISKYICNVLEFIHQELANALLDWNDLSNFDRVAIHAH